MNTIINIVLKGALVAAALCAAPAYAETVDFSKIPDVRIFKGDETIGYRDPAAWYEDGVFHLFITVCDPSVPRMTIGHSTSRNLVDWSPIKYVLPMDKRFNWSSPGNIVKDGDERVLCFQKYPTPDATPTKVAFADDTARLYTIRTKDFKTWTKPEIIMFFHGSGPRKEIEGDCYKNCSIGIAWSDDLKEWTWPGKACK